MTPPKLPSAEDLLYELSQVTDVPDGDFFRAKLIHERDNLVLEAAAEVAEHIGSELYELRVTYNEAVGYISDEIRKLKEEL